MNFDSDPIVLIEVLLRYAVKRRLHVVREDLFRVFGIEAPFAGRRRIKTAARTRLVDLRVVRVALVNIFARALLEPCECVVDRGRVVREGIRDIVERLLFCGNIEVFRSVRVDDLARVRPAGIG